MQVFLKTFGKSSRNLNETPKKTDIPPPARDRVGKDFSKKDTARGGALGDQILRRAKIT
jgi:hypothetical protein